MPTPPTIKPGITEDWKPVPDFPGYEVSNLGRVRSYRSINGRGGFCLNPRLLKLLDTPKKEYLRVGLVDGMGGVKHIPVHTLVLMVFVGPRPSKDHDCCHADGNARNNTLSNLRWDTKQANAADRISHGTQIRGEAVGIAVLTEDQVKEIKDALPAWKRGMGRFFARKFDVGDSAISAIKQGLTWSHV